MLHQGKSQFVPGRRPLIRAAVLIAAACGIAFTSQAQTGYSGMAYGTKVTVTPGTTGITSGTTAESTICTEQTGMSASNSAASVSLPGLASTGVIDTSVSSAVVGSSNTATGLATVNGLSLLGGLVSADAVQ